MILSLMSLVLLMKKMLCQDLTIATMNLALGGTKYTKSGRCYYWEQENCLDRTVYDNLIDMANVIDGNNIDIIALQELDVKTNRISEETSEDCTACATDRHSYGYQPDTPQFITDYLNTDPDNEYLARFVNAQNMFNGEYGNAIISNTKRFIDPYRKDKINRVTYNAVFDETRAYIAQKFLFENHHHDADDTVYQLWFVSTHLAKREEPEVAKEQLKELMEDVSTYSYPTIICGDFNLDWDLQKNDLLDIFEDNGFENIMTEEDYFTFPKGRDTKIDYCLYNKNGRNWFDIDMNSVEYISPWNENQEPFTDHWGIKFNLALIAGN